LEPSVETPRNRAPREPSAALHSLGARIATALAGAIAGPQVTDYGAAPPVLRRRFFQRLFGM